MNKAITTIGRKTKLTKELINKISGYISKGSTVKDACFLCMIGRKTFYNWMNKAKKINESDNKINEKEKLFIHFLHTIKRALIEFEAFHLKNIIDQSEKHWQASAWLLERRFPQEWGRNRTIGQFSKLEKLFNNKV